MKCSNCGASAPSLQVRLVNGRWVPLCPFCITRGIGGWR